jgi:hypothetical protein
MAVVTWEVANELSAGVAVKSCHLTPNGYLPAGLIVTLALSA